ncbi:MULTISPECIES: N-acetyl-gamma-glutamyl-phosphate reductase [unclassified Enterococcus]|uniref:N-acetyl-gamma-glutamyl-phosphate reductase n=1 Tax=unclassified Enterococcus TaxID=2608891 RepID=UPI001554614A|nr:MULTISPECIES: N-acetyl-gamma-glutamyl-phosphate reductase [unclassified Enterococcus]MBS7576358.1 N-acetyl-gamma-glutamyl-phosphate reductase [Enterococcus sp. MMGLQ5-2]MBS7583590.1 N-acetyl-gamma-glutamyl-phosphate reductase [Enterococcus sp. MMGLQ5-1]NPD11452.1 N-acetyl-gamma-glutamyl-phosphate reductase [Enterococcus sp. MMGLQ5-1]NPD36196.1 N-acetyl-gamma-glutamyl-phosphate reductase [Enterococcus sp. MMGLQ5-2]
MKVSIIGVTGYSGLELVRLLHSHPEVEIAGVYGTQNIGKKISELYPHLMGILDLPLKEINHLEIMAASDLVFFATPSGVSREAAIQFIENQFPVIDLSGDFRLDSAESYQKWYSKPATHAAHLKQAVYGLADFLDKSSTAGTTLIANPGCYATASILSLAPVVIDDLIDPESIIIDAKSGLSGAGKKLSDASHYVEVNDNMSAYKINQHQHIPEIMLQFNRWNTKIPAIQFSTSLIPVTRGIFVTSYVKLKSDVTYEAVKAAYHELYQDKVFIRVMENDQTPQLKQVIGTNYTDIGLSYNPVTNTLMVVTVIDNLIKGAAGQAIQNLNLFADFDQFAGLDFAPVFP